MRNVAPSPMPSQGGGGSTGSDAEDFEVTEYQVHIETRVLGETCTTLSDLKALDYVIFENANEYDRGCIYVFKVNRDNVEEILAVINSLDPKDFSENTHTIKRVLTDFTSELEILERKQQSIGDTLESAVSAYDELIVLATRIEDVESLTKHGSSRLRGLYGM